MKEKGQDDKAKEPEVIEKPVRPKLTEFEDSDEGRKNYEAKIRNKPSQST